MLRGLRGAALLLLVLVDLGCGGQVASEMGGCGPTTLTDCPQDTLPTAAECPLPPIPGAQGYFMIGCQASAVCGHTRVACVCGDSTAGPTWTCSL